MPVEIQNLEQLDYQWVYEMSPEDTNFSGKPYKTFRF